MSGIKIVLRVPKETDKLELEDEESSNGHDDSNDFDAENSNSCTGGASSSAADENSLLCTFASITDSSATSTPVASTHAESHSFVAKRRRRKRRFKFTMPPQKSSKFKRKIDDDSAPEKDLKRKSGAEDAQADQESSSIRSDAQTITESVARTIEISALQKLLIYMLDYLEKKDPNQYFMRPLPENASPDDGQVVKIPMDFSIMRQKLESGLYSSLPQFKSDVELIYTNAMQYYKPGTTFYIAAEKLRSIADYLFSRDRLMYFLKTEPFVSNITTSELGCELYKGRILDNAPKQKMDLTRYACIVDDMNADDVLFQASLAAENAREKLAARKPNCKTAHVNTSQDGTLTLKLITPETIESTDSVQSAAPSEDKVYSLAHLIPKLKEGTPLQTKQDIRPLCTVVPYTTLDYGSFASFAPIFDSTWSSLSKEESDLLLSSFGNDQGSVDYVDSVRKFVRGSSDELIYFVDNLLDALTDGEYKKQLRIDSQEYVEHVAEDVDMTKNLIDRTSVSFQTSNDNAIQAPDRLQTADELLAKNSALLTELQKSQYDRLSRPPPLSLSDLQGPTMQETQIADQLLTGLQALTSRSSPDNLVSTKTVRSFMGINELKPIEANESNGSEEYDMEVFKEFFEV